MIGRITGMAAIVTMLMTNTPAFAEAIWAPVAERIAGHLEQSVTEYRAGDAQQAQRSVIQAYFGVFETEKMEAAMRTRMGMKHTYQVERRFGGLRKAIKAGVPPEEFESAAAELSGILREDAATLDADGVTADVFRINRQ